ncbi:MAG: RNA polymerase sigma factor [Microthrixaceae bacterium]
MDRQRLETFVLEEYPRVVAAVGFACGDRTAGEDAVQDVLATTLEREFEVTNLRAWVVAAALNRVRSGVRRRGAEGRAFERLLRRPPVIAAAVPELDDVVLEALRSLPERQRQITALHYLLDMSISEVAATLEVSDGTVKTQLHRAREALRSRLDQRAGGENDEEDDHVRR